MSVLLHVSIVVSAVTSMTIVFMASSPLLPAFSTITCVLIQTYVFDFPSGPCRLQYFSVALPL